MTKIGYAAMMEQFTPTDLLDWCAQAEEAGFEAGLMVSEHFHPWTPQQAGQIMSQFVGTIREHLPNASFSLDISPWVEPDNGEDDGAQWYSNFDMSLFSFVNTSGGGTDAASDTIRDANNMTWAGVSNVTGKPVLADTGYGVNGSPAGHDAAWDNVNNINDRIADSVFQQVLTRTADYDVFATPNLNGDYLSDACAAQVGGLGMAPGANVGDEIAVFEATHGTAPKYAGKDVINPGSVILSGVMMLNHLGWSEAAALIEKALAATVSQKKVTYDMERLMTGATKVKTSEFAKHIIENMG